MLKLYERFSVEPEFLNNNNSYIWCYAAWMMKNALNHENNMYVKHITDLEPEYCEIPYLTGYFPRPEPEAVRSEVRDMACQMPEQYQTLYAGIVQGYEMQEIGQMLGIGKFAITRRKHIMVETLGKAWRASHDERKQLIQEMAGYRHTEPAFE